MLLKESKKLLNFNYFSKQETMKHTTKRKSTFNNSNYNLKKTGLTFLVRSS